MNTHQTKPRTLFLIDGIGAVVSSIMLGLVLPKFQHLIGMPLVVLKGLTIAAVMFAIYSLTCYAVQPKRWHIYLRTIGIVNLIYCAVSIGLVIYYYPQLTILGLTYFALEKVIVFSLAMIELKTSYTYKD